MKRISLAAFLLLSLTFALQADDAPAKPPLTAGILPARAPDQAGWKITITYGAPADAGSPGGCDHADPFGVAYGELCHEIG